jgi:FixJ family two-component response regulator
MIFVIDDDQSVLRALLLLLRSAGFDAKAFSSAVDFLIESHVSENDCIILDLSMPGMSGFDLMARLASRGINARIIVITAYDDSENRERALKLKAAAFLTKPVDDQALIDTIKWTAQTGKTGTLSDAQKQT